MTHTQIDPKQEQQERSERIREQLAANKQTWVDSLKAEKDRYTLDISQAIDAVIEKATKEV